MVGCTLLVEKFNFSPIANKAMVPAKFAILFPGTGISLVWRRYRMNIYVNTKAFIFIGSPAALG